MVRVAIPFLFALTLSATAWAGNWNKSNVKPQKPNETVKVSDVINIFAPDTVLQKFQNTEMQKKKNFCEASSIVWQKISVASENPPLRIQGFNSRMDNDQEVEGNEASSSFYKNMSEAYADAIVNEQHREFILSHLHKWAKVGALTKTVNCFATKSCGKYWGRSDGQDPYPGHDINHSLLRGHFLAFGYFATMPNFKPDDPRHILIQDWLSKFLTDAPSTKRRKRHMDPFKWGILLRNEINHSSNKNLAEKILKSSFEYLNQDGSIREHTMRGNRSLWYHSAGLNEILINMEIARKYGIKIPDEMHRRVEKAVTIFVQGFKDHSFLDQWAAKGYNGVYKKGVQVYERDLALVHGGNTWWYIFQYRYPSSPVAIELGLLTEKNLRTKDLLLGFGLGCIYRSLLPDVDNKVADLRPKKTPVDLLKMTSVNLKKLDDRDKYLSFRLKLAKESKNISGPNVSSIKVMIDFAGEDQKINGNPAKLRVEIESADFLEPANAIKAVGCEKSTIKKKGDTLIAYRLYSGAGQENNECALSTMTEAGRKEAESLLATLGQIFANDNVKKSDPYGVLEKHSQFLKSAAGN
jgi:hypothetical protein